MKAVSLGVVIVVAGLAAGALVELLAGECDQPICWGGASPGLLMILAGGLATLTVSVGVLAVGIGIAAGALTGLSVSLGAGAAVMFSGSPGTAGTNVNLPNCADNVPGRHLGLRGGGWRNGQCDFCSAD